MIYLVLGFVFLLFIILTLLIIVISPYIILQPFRKTTQYFAERGFPVNPAAFGLKYSNIKIKSFDGKYLIGWFIKARIPKGTIIDLHGISDSRISGLSFIEFFVDNGYNVLAYDSRGQGESEGNFCTYGFYEKLDVKYAIDFLMDAKEFNVGKIGIMGISLGAAIALQSISEESRISCCISEASFADLKQIIVDYQKQGLFYLTIFLRKLIFKRVEKIGNFKIEEVSPMNAVTKSKIPILFLHGSDDSRISSTYVEQLFNNTPSIKEMEVISGADHNNLRDIGGDTYKQKILLFLDKYLSPNDFPSDNTKLK